LKRKNFAEIENKRILTEFARQKICYPISSRVLEIQSENEQIGMHYHFPNSTNYNAIIPIQRKLKLDMRKAIFMQNIIKETRQQYIFQLIAFFTK
jgi:hypothetical protein